MFLPSGSKQSVFATSRYKNQQLFFQVLDLLKHQKQLCPNQPGFPVRIFARRAQILPAKPAQQPLKTVVPLPTRPKADDLLNSLDDLASEGRFLVVVHVHHLHQQSRLYFQGTKFQSR